MSSRKQPDPVAGTFSVSQEYPLTDRTAFLPVALPLPIEDHVKKNEGKMYLHL